MKRYVCLILLFLLGAEGVFSQKRPMKLDDCKLWRSVDQIQLSENGKWVVYNYRALYRQDLDTTYIYNVQTGETICG